MTQDHRVSLLAWAKACVLTKTNSPIPKSSLPSAFLLLPHDIRLRIYIYLLGDHTIHVESLIHNAHYHRRRSSRETLCGKEDRSHDFSIFLFTKSLWCWGRPDHRVCNTRKFCIDFMDQQMLKQLGSHLYRDRAFTGPDLHIPHNWCTHEPAQTALDLRILRTCRQVYEEAKLIPYHTNTFAFDSPSAMARFCVRSFQLSKHPWNKYNAFESLKSQPTQTEENVTIPISEIRNLQIHATYRGRDDRYNWDNICFHTAHLWTGLRNFSLNIDVLPEGGAIRNHWITPESYPSSGFCAYRNSPLRTVSVDVSDEYRHLFCTEYPFEREKAHYWSTKEQKKGFEDGLRHYLLDLSPSHS